MPRDENETEESEWEEEGEGAGDDAGEDSDEVISKNSKKRRRERKRRPPAAKSSASTKKTKVTFSADSNSANDKKNDDNGSDGDVPGSDVEEDDDDAYEHLPTSARKTERGGYAHKKSTKLKISMQNRGKMPWNKGKQRSGSDRAKIGAGVRARNRKILLEKLEALGMTEDEWNKKKRQIKLIRERLRTARKANRELEEEKKRKESEQEAKQDGNYQQRPLESKELKEEQSAGSDDDKDKDGEEESGSDSEDERVGKELAAISSIFARDYRWSPARHPAGGDRHDDRNSNPPAAAAASEQQQPSHPSSSSGPRFTRCPNGGVGGLICCAACTAQYSKYLSSTFLEMERQKISRMTGEVKDLVGILNTSSDQLSRAVQAAKEKKSAAAASSG